MNIIECRDLTKSYKAHNAINKLSFEIKENTITGLIGRNGAGKTTLLKLIAGFYRKSEGELNVFSQDPFNNLQVATNVIFIDDNMVFPSSLNLAEILQSANSFYPNWDQELSSKLLNYFSLNPNQFHHSLSKGMKSTFNMIVGIASRSPLTIFDEPTTGMDVSIRKDFYRALLKDYINFPRTILLSSHLLNEMEDILENILLIDNGELKLHKQVEEMQTMAIGLQGNGAKIKNMINSSDVLYSEEIGDGYTNVVTINHFSDKDIQKLKKEGIQVSAVSTNDLCVYLTGKNKGGIDHVFSEHKRTGNF